MDHTVWSIDAVTILHLLLSLAYLKLGAVRLPSATLLTDWTIAGHIFGQFLGVNESLADSIGLPVQFDL